MIENYTFWVYLCLPLLGYFLSPTKPLRFVPNKVAFNVVVVVLCLAVASLLTKVSFSLDFLDEVIVGSGLFAMGYLGAGLERAKSKLHKNLVKSVRRILLVFYVTLPLTLWGLVMMSFGGDKIGQTVHLDESKDYRIKHMNIHSSFTSPGYHVATVYGKKFVFEYPIKTFELGEYGRYGFNSYAVLGDRVMIPHNKFEYDEASESLRLLKYKYGKYSYLKTFESP